MQVCRDSFILIVNKQKKTTEFSKKYYICIANLSKNRKQLFSRQRTSLSVRADCLGVFPPNFRKQNPEPLDIQRDSLSSGTDRNILFP